VTTCAAGQGSPVRDTPHGTSAGESALGVTGGRRRGLRVLASSASRGVAIDDLAVRSRLAGVNGVGVGSGRESFCQ
jgi:hypothetical protein